MSYKIIKQGQGHPVFRKHDWQEVVPGSEPWDAAKYGERMTYLRTGNSIQRTLYRCACGAEMLEEQEIKYE